MSNIRPTANEQSLRLLFESAGQVLGCKLVKDEGSTGHKGFGFVMMASLAEAESAAQKFSNFEVIFWTLDVSSLRFDSTSGCK